MSMRWTNAGVVVLLVALTACATDSPAPVVPSAATHAAPSETESPPVSRASTSTLPHECAPPLARVEITWAGTTTAGEPVPSGRYQPHGVAVVRHVDPPQDACDPEAGSKSYVGAGLGHFAVVSSS